MTKTKYKENPQHKDREYTADDVEKVTTLEDTIYIKMKNDISFLLGGYMDISESTGEKSYLGNRSFRELEMIKNYKHTEGVGMNAAHVRDMANRISDRFKYIEEEF